MKKTLHLLAVCVIAMLFGDKTVFAQTNIFPSYYEGFELTNGSWSASGSNSTWAWGTPAYSSLTTAGEGTRCWKTNLTGTYLNSDASFLTSPAYDFTCFATDPTISFLKWQQIESGYDYLDLQLSTDGGSTWTTLGTTASGGTNWYTHSSNRWNGAQTAWTTCSHIMTGMAGKSNVRVRFRFTSDGSVTQIGVGLDAIRIEVPGGPTTAPPPTLFSPIDGAINVPLSTTLSWSTSICAQSYEMQVSTSPVFASIFASQSGIVGGSANLVGLAYETLYYWRVRSILNGVAGVWSTARSFSTLPPPPNAPILTSPDNNLTNLDPTNVFLIWTPDPRAANYRVQMARDAGFTQILLDRTTTSASEDVRSLMSFGSRYYWRVNASNGTGTSPWSVVWTFATALPTPTLVFPPEAEKELSVPVRFEWTGLTGVTVYTLQIASDMAFTSIVYNTDVTGLQANVSTLEMNTRYFWRIRAVGSGGITSNFTSARSFSTLVSTPVLSAPNDGALDVAINMVSFSWMPNPKPASYRVQISKSSTFISSSDIIYDKTVTGLTTMVDNLPANSTLYWRIRAEDGILGVSYWSQPYTFSTTMLPVINTAPADNSRALGIPIRMEWTSAGSNASYDLQIATDKGFSTIVISRTVQGMNADDIGMLDGLKNFTQYWWRVRPRSASGVDIAWSQANTFTTKIGGAVVQMPLNNATDISTNTRFEWKPVDGAETYSIIISKNADLSDPIASASAMVKNTFSLPASELELNTVYYWQVTAASTNDGTTTSTTWTFTTAAAKIAAIPGLLLPENAAILPTGTVELKWEVVSGAVSYDVQVSPDQNFATLLYDGKGQTASSWTIDANTPEQTLYWRVRSVNGAGLSAWSAARRFSLAAEALAAPGLVSPPSNAIKVEPSVIFSWAAALKAISYHVQVSTDENFTTLVYNKNKIIGQSTTPLQLANATKYFWRVSSENDMGVSAWSATWNFTTSTAIASSVTDESNYGTVVSPQPANDMITLTFNSEWNDVSAIKLFNMSGQNVLTINNVTSSVLMIPTENIAAGMYMLEISRNKGVSTMPVIINR